MSSRKGKIFVVSSPSGGGKTTLSRELLKRVKNLARSVSMTTRFPRYGETQGRDYFFVTEDTFRRTRSSGGFLEEALVFGRRYGTPRRFVERETRRGRDVLLLIDVKGAMQVKKRRSDAVLIFVMPPSLKELKVRLVGRSTEPAGEVKERLDTGRREMRVADRYDYVVENRDFKKAAAELEAIVTAERLKARR